MAAGSEIQQQADPSSSEESSVTQPPNNISLVHFPMDLRGLLYDRLFTIDRVAFALVCSCCGQCASSRLRLSFPLILPPLHCIRDSRLRSPFNRNIYLPYQPPEAGIIACCGSVGSWLLYHKFTDGQRSFFVDPAFNNERVDLPPWRLPGRPLQDAIISAAPTDPGGCTVVFLSAKMIVYCRVGDEMWSSCEVDTYLEKSTGAFLNSELYVIDELQRLGVVNFRNIENAVTWLGMDVGPLQERLGLPIQYGTHFLMESSGTLFLVFLGKGRCWYVFRADLKAMTWRGVEDLGDRSLFLAPDRSASAVAVEAGVEANRLYFARAESNEAALADWISVATHRRDNCWVENSLLRYNTDASAAIIASRWVFQRVVVIDNEPHA